MNYRKKDEQGFVLIVIAVLLTALIGFVALGVDVGVLYSARASAQKIADAAALAGAFTFINNPTALQPSTASTHAQQVALNNSIMGKSPTASDIIVDVNVEQRRVTVQLKFSQNTYFAHALGTESVDVGVRAIAEASEYSIGAGCVKPWFIPSTVFAASAACAACAANEVLISGGEITAFGKSKIGQQFTIKPQRPSDAIGPGQFYAIQLPGSVGAADYRENIATCSDRFMRCADSYSVETGNMVGPTTQGVSEMIGLPPDDDFIEVGRYARADGTISDMSKAVVISPIWDTCNKPGFCPGGKFGNGTNVNLQIVGFASFFLEGVQGTNVVARLINVSACGTLPAASTPTGSSVLSLPLRLIRTP